MLEKILLLLQIFVPVFKYLTKFKSNLYEILRASELIFKEVGTELIITEENNTESSFMHCKFYKIKIEIKN
jgi:hypothetical protein